MKITNIKYQEKESWENYKEEIWVALDRGNGEEIWHFKDGVSCYNQTRHLKLKEKVNTIYLGIYNNEFEATCNHPFATYKSQRKYENGRWRFGKDNKIKVDIDGEVARKFENAGFTKKQFDEHINKIVASDYEKTIKLKEEKKMLLEKLAQIDEQLNVSKGV